MGAVGLDEGAAAGVSKSSARRLPNKKHSGNASSHFLGTAGPPANQRRNRATVSSSNRNTSASRDRSVNLSQSKSRRRVFTSAICLSKIGRASGRERV